MENNRKEIEYIDRYLAYCETRSVPAKTVVIETGEVSDSLFYILEGTLTVSVTDESGREMILAYLSEGEFFGELGVYDDGQQQRSASVRTRTDCVIGKMDYQRFHELAKIYPSLMKPPGFPGCITIANYH